MNSSCMCRRKRQRIIGEIDVEICLTGKEGVDAGDMGIGHRLAQNDGLDR